MQWRDAEECLVEFETSTDNQPDEQPKELTQSEIHRISREARQRHGIGALAKQGKVTLRKREPKE